MINLSNASNLAQHTDYIVKTRGENWLLQVQRSIEKQAMKGSYELYTRCNLPIPIAKIYISELKNELNKAGYVVKIEYRYKEKPELYISWKLRED